MLRIGRATGRSNEHRGFHAPGTTGPFGAAIACFESALRLVARHQKISLPEGTAITAEVRLIRRPDALYALAATLTGHLPGIPTELARSLMDAAHQVCPYSNATRGQFSLDLRVEGAAPEGEVVAA